MAEKLEVVKLLLEHGADKRALTTDDYTPRDVARKWGSPEIVELLQFDSPSTKPGR